MNTDTPTAALGFGHFLTQTDLLGKTLLGILLLMSIMSWSIIVIKSINALLRSHHNLAFLKFFWNAASLTQVAQHLSQSKPSSPFAHLVAQAIEAQAHHTQYGQTNLAQAGSSAEFVGRTIKKVLDEQTTRLENGLTVLATIGATAPFIGLFGTVWGVYHALVAIGMSGAGTLDKVAGPVGEALIMTALGLAVAIPAVMGYNGLTRSNRVTLSKLDAFAHDVHTFVAMGAARQST